MAEDKKKGKTPSPPAALRVFDKKDLEAAREVVFVPSASQKKARHRFHEHWDGHTEPTMAQALQLTEMTKIEKWWPKPGFKEWFLRKESMNARLNYLVELSLDAAEAILMDDDEKNRPNQLAAMKVVLAYRSATQERMVEDDPYRALPSEELLRLIKKRNEDLNIIDVEDVSEGEESE